MLPAYLSYFVGFDDDRVAGRGTSIARGLAVGAAVSAGFLVVLGVSGALFNAGFRSIIDYVPWAALVVGVALTVLGVAMLAFGVQLNVALPHLERGGSSRRYRSMFLFGVSYAVASLSCALPVFLAVTGAASATPTFLSGVLTYVAYGLGMSMLLLVLTIALSVAKEAVVRRLRRLLPYVGRLWGRSWCCRAPTSPSTGPRTCAIPWPPGARPSGASSGSRPGSPTSSAAAPSCGRRCSVWRSRPRSPMSCGPDGLVGW
jgi:cytochrome c-type biogenesis protein